MAVFAILRHILSPYSNQKTTCASSISAVRENRSPWNHQRFLAGQKVTGRFMCYCFFLAGCQSRKRLRLIDARPTREQAHILARPCKLPGFSMFDMNVLSTKKQEGLVAGVCWCSMTSVKLSADSVDEEKKSPVKAGNDSFWKWSWLTGPSIHGAQQKSRRCSAKESSVLRGSSQYTLRNQLTAMHREVVIRGQNIVKS